MRWLEILVFVCSWICLEGEREEESWVENDVDTGDEKLNENRKTW